MSKELINLYKQIYNESHLTESNPIAIANKINELGTNAISNNDIDILLNTMIYNEAKGRHEIPIGNGRTISLLDINDCQSFCNQIINHINIRNGNIIDVERKIKKAINNVYQGNDGVPFPEVITDDN